MQEGEDVGGFVGLAAHRLALAVAGLVLDPHVGDGVLHVAAMAASCDDTAAAIEFPACHVHQQDWGVPVRLVEGAPARLQLYLAG